MSTDNKVIIFDTTLRDGEQAAGATMTVDQKVEIAHRLDKLGVDVIEAGFPVSSPGELAAVQRIAREVGRPIICALSHANNKAVDAAWDAVKDAKRKRIHIFLSTSEIHMYHQLHKDREEILSMACENVARARGYCDDIEFSPMDATRSDPEYLYRLLEATIDSGATTINIPDTVGYTTPEEFYQLIRGIFENVRNIDKARISVHCHNDLGMAVANSLAAVRAGARQIECTINGIGERAGNASLEEVAMALKTRADTYDLDTNIDTTQITRTSKLVSQHTGFAVQPNKAIVGKNAFRHASGIHQDGMMKHQTTYEIMEPQSVGLSGSTLVLGKLSGRHAFQKRMDELGYPLEGDELAAAFESFKEVAEVKKEVSDADLEALVADQRRSMSDAYSLESVQVACGTDEVPTATVRIKGPDEKDFVHTASGTGPVDAAYKAIDQVVGVEARLEEFSVQSITEGIDAIGDVMVRIERQGMTYVGRGASTDIIVAAAKAYVNALNRLISEQSLPPAASQAAKVGP
jgi:2-isopropylmalate synthase